MKKKIFLFLAFILLMLLCMSFSLSVGIGLVHQRNAEYYQKLIYIDPGHGGMDGGAVSGDKTVIEKEVVLNISYKLKEALEKLGYHVKLTREKDSSIAKSKKEDIYKRVDLINNSQAILFISIHANSFPSPKAKGAQTFYSERNDNNALLARIIMERLKLIDPTNQRVAKLIENKYLLDHVDISGCLIEVGFLTNNEDLMNLTDAEYISNLAWMIAFGIEQYILEVGN